MMIGLFFNNFMAVTLINQETFQKEVLEHKGVVFVDFYADWCIAPESKILLSSGEHKSARNIQSGDELVGLGEKGKSYGSVGFSKVVVDSGHCKEVIVETGRKIKVTDDHLFYTKYGWLAADKLKSETEVAVYPAADIIEIKDEVDEKELILARLTGLLLSDGTLYQQKKNHYYEVSFTVGQSEDAEQLRQDLVRLGFSRTHLKKVVKEQKIAGRRFTSHTSRLKCLSKDLLKLLVKRGVPVGSKKSQAYQLPRWILQGKTSIKREFLRGYLGGDGPRVTIRISKGKERSSYNTVSINDLEFHKDIRFEKSALTLAREIASLLKEFGVDITKIFAKKDSYLRKDGQNSSIIHMQFKHDFSTALAIIENIGYAYCKQKQEISEIAGEFLRQIFYLRKSWTELYQKAKELSSLGYGYRRISRMLQINPTQAWTWIKGRAKATIAHHGLKFDSWLKEKLKNAPSGFIWEKIVDVKPVFLPTVAKISVEPTHSFIANGFLSHNCAPCKVTFPIIDELSNEKTDTKFLKVDVDKNPELAQQYSIFSIPTFMIFKDGKPASQFVGAMGKEGFLNEIKKVTGT